MMSPYLTYFNDDKNVISSQYCIGRFMCCLFWWAPQKYGLSLLFFFYFNGRTDRYILYRPYKIFIFVKGDGPKDEWSWVKDLRGYGGDMCV